MAASKVVFPDVVPSNENIQALLEVDAKLAQTAEVANLNVSEVHRNLARATKDPGIEPATP